MQDTTHKKADKLAIHGTFNLPYHDREDFLLQQLTVQSPLTKPCSLLKARYASANF